MTRMNEGRNRNFGTVQEDVAALLEKYNIFKVLLALKDCCEDRAYELQSGAASNAWEEIALRLYEAIDKLDLHE